MSAVRKALLIIITILVLVGAAWLIADHYRSTHKSANQTATGSEGAWAEYTSQQYGFKFEYLKTWGTPKVTAQTSAPNNTQSGAPKVAKFTGAQYVISFPDIQSSKPVTATLDSTDYSNQTCLTASQCATNNAFTQTDIQSLLSASGANMTVSVLNKGSNFYSTLNYTQGTGVLSISQIVNLPKIKVNAAVATYTVSGASSDCKNNSLAANAAGCVTQTEYDNLSQFAGSLQPL